MKYEEQLYKNLNRVYYHGKIKNYNGEKRFDKELTYLTTDFMYALWYAKKDGCIESYTLKKPINIFNSRSAKDFDKLISLNSSIMHFSQKVLYRLKDEDWNYVFLTEYNEPEFKAAVFKVLYDAGYDGFFNFEFSKNMAKKISFDSYFSRMSLDDKTPAIGVIDMKNFIKVDELHGLKDFETNDAFIKYKTLERSYLKNDIGIALDDGFTCDDIVNNMIIESLATSDEEIINLVNSFSYKNYKEEQNKFLKIFNEYVRYNVNIKL